MNNIKNIHKSPVFTILTIIFTFTGIISSLHYSKDNNIFFKDSFEKSFEIRKKNFIVQNNYRTIDLGIGSLEYRDFPIDSVPIKVVLGKIEKIENPYIPELYLSFFEAEKNIISLNVY